MLSYQLVESELVYLLTSGNHVCVCVCVQVHLVSSFILNGVCVKWVGYIDLESLNGKAALSFDSEQAKVGPE